MTLEELALAIEADLPQPDPAFAEEMDALVEAGFPRRERRRLPRPRLLALGGGLAAAATAAVVAVVALGGQHQAPKSVATSPPPRPQAASGPFVQPPSANAQAPLRQAPSLQSLLQPSAGLQGGARRVERSADVTLAAPDDRLEEVADGVVAVARRRHGFVEHESVSTGVPDAGGSLDLRVPVGELDATLRDLSGVAHVRARTETADDVTREYAAVKAKLDEARRNNVLRRGVRPVSIQRIQRLDARLRVLSLETNFADVQVTLQVDRHGAATGSSTSRALHDALGILVGAVDFGIRALAVLIPLGLVAAALVAVVRALRRRRREAVLA